MVEWGESYNFELVDGKVIQNEADCKVDWLGNEVTILKWADIKD